MKQYKEMVWVTNHKAAAVYHDGYALLLEVIGDHIFYMGHVQAEVAVEILKERSVRGLHYSSSFSIDKLKYYDIEIQTFYEQFLENQLLRD